MRELPTGTVTLLFSDIEGSTALLSRLGDRYGAALSAQRELMRAAISASGGLEMGTEGDSFYVVFEAASHAVGCCLAAQHSLAAHEWPGGAAVRVRMGLHSGEPARHEDGYIGMDVHRAARIAAAAHGGQVVLSEATRLLAQPRLPAGVSVRDLGWHRLKDISVPERIHQLVIPGLPDQFPPLKSLGAQTSLPVPPSPLVGRDAELARLCATVARPGVRLVTLTGTGGVGKTRLALAAAAALDQAFPDGIYFVALAAVREAEIMWKEIADELGVSSDRSPEDAVIAYLAARQALLVLDNLEQLHGAAEAVSRLLTTAPRLVVLATARGPLHAPGEHQQLVPPLEVPNVTDAEEVAVCSAVRLFVQQAGLVRPGFTITEANAADVAAICRRLDGLPLAIELAASRLKLLGPRALTARLGNSLDLLASQTGQPSRQQTLRNTVAWSYDLLAPELAEVFRRMAVFAGGCDLDALAAVAVVPVQAEPADPVQLASDLLDASLITVLESADSEPRVGMLETIRQFALERLQQACELDDASCRHAAYYAAIAERAAGRMRGAEHLAALDTLEAEHDNLRTALAWSLQVSADGAADDQQTAIGLRLVQALGPFWHSHGHVAEARRWLQRAMDIAADQARVPPARMIDLLGGILRMQGEHEAAIPLLQRSLAISRAEGDRAQEARTLNSLALAYRYLGDLDTARSLFEDSIAISRELGGVPRLSVRLANLGHLEIDAGNLDRAMQVLQEALALDRAEGERLGAAHTLESLAWATLRAGRANEASQLLSAALADVVNSGDIQLIAQVLELSAAIAADRGDTLPAARLAGAAEAVRQHAGIPLPELDAALLERFLGPTRATVPREAWDAEQAAGRALSQQQATALLAPPG
jgi:predicted ATPase/class 3 adenylate cyclase/Tfp pilus assembly protein PilF